MLRGGRAHGTREEEAIDSAGSRGTGVAFSRRIHLVSARENPHSRRSRRSTCGLRCSPCTHHSLKCSQLLLNKR